MARDSARSRHARVTERKRDAIFEALDSLKARFGESENRQAWKAEQTKKRP